MIKFFFINLTTMIIINQFRINSKNKVLFFLIINYLFLFLTFNSIIHFIEMSIVMLCSLFLFANCYTIRYSSLRIKILNDIKKKKKITSEYQLYKERIKRFKKNKNSLMNKNFFLLFNYANNFFKYLFF